MKRVAIYARVSTLFLTDNDYGNETRCVYQEDLNGAENSWTRSGFDTESETPWMVSQLEKGAPHDNTARHVGRCPEIGALDFYIRPYLVSNRRHTDSSVGGIRSRTSD